MALRTATADEDGAFMATAEERIDSRMRGSGNIFSEDSSADFEVKEERCHSTVKELLKSAHISHESSVVLVAMQDQRVLQSIFNTRCEIAVSDSLSVMYWSIGFGTGNPGRSSQGCQKEASLARTSSIQCKIVHVSGYWWLLHLRII